MAYGLQSIVEGNQDRNASRGHGRMLLAGQLSVSCSACFPIQPMATCPGVAQPIVGYPTAQLIINQENAPIGLLISDSDGGMFSQMTQACRQNTNTAVLMAGPGGAGTGRGQGWRPGSEAGMHGLLCRRTVFHVCTDHSKGLICFMEVTSAVQLRV